MRGHPRLGLPLEEGVVQLLVVDVDLAQLRPDLLSHLRLQVLRVLLLLKRGPHLHDAGLLDEVRKFKRRLFDASLALKIFPLEAPVSGNGHGVAARLEQDQQAGVLGGHVVHLDNI